jgi:pyruvate formate lyase activating enzyme
MLLADPRPPILESAASQAKLPPLAEGYVHSCETFGTVDGPGIRYVLFMAGCPLRCQYCHNPDAWRRGDGIRLAARDVLGEISCYRGFFQRSGGGVTLSGGEPLAQPRFCKDVLRGCKRMNLHTALDTSGYLGHAADDELLRDVDLVLLDIKAFSERVYRELTGAPLQPTIEFARRLAALGKPVWLRYVLVPGLTDNLNEIQRLAEFSGGLGNIERVDVLPFHNLGAHKWRARGLKYRLADRTPPSESSLQQARSVFRAAGLAVN